MAILRESPWYQEILKEGEKIGIQQEIISSIELGLQLKFGDRGLTGVSAFRLLSDFCSAFCPDYY